MRLPDAFEPLRGERVWVAWDYEDGAKVPRSKDGGRASTTNPSTWGTYDEVAAAAEHYGWAGVGIVLTDGYAGIDLDGAIGPDGSLLPWAEEIVDSMDSYTEVSPSGTGVHIIVWTDRGQTGPIGRNDREQGIEVYNHGRYFTVTGDSIGADSIADRTSEVEGLVGRLNGPNPEQTLSQAVGAMVYDQVKRLSNRTVSQNCVRDGVRYARVPVGRETCGFCLMLASRGFVYESERSAGELNHYHTHCDCKVIPGFDGMEVEGYDPDALMDVYESVYYDELGGRQELRRMWSGLSDRDKDERIARHAGSEADAFDAFCEERISDGIALAVYGTTRPHAD